MNVLRRLLLTLLETNATREEKQAKKLLINWSVVMKSVQSVFWMKCVPNCQIFCSGKIIFKCFY